jgi:hypothetical protein
VPPWLLPEKPASSPAPACLSTPLLGLHRAGKSPGLGTHLSSTSEPPTPRDSLGRCSDYTMVPNPALSHADFHHLHIRHPPLLCARRRTSIPITEPQRQSKETGSPPHFPASAALPSTEPPTPTPQHSQDTLGTTLALQCTPFLRAPLCLSRNLTPAPLPQGQLVAQGPCTHVT